MPGGISQFSATFAIAAAVAKGDVVFAENVSAAPKCDAEWRGDIIEVRKFHFEFHIFIEFGLICPKVDTMWTTLEN